MSRIEAILKRVIELVTGTRADALEVEMSKLAGDERRQVREAWVEEKVKGYVAGAALAGFMMLLNVALDRWFPKEA